MSCARAWLRLTALPGSFARCRRRGQARCLAHRTRSRDGGATGRPAPPVRHRAARPLHSRANCPRVHPERHCDATNPGAFSWSRSLRDSRSARATALASAPRTNPRHEDDAGTEADLLGASRLRCGLRHDSGRTGITRRRGHNASGTASYPKPQGARRSDGTARRGRARFSDELRSLFPTFAMELDLNLPDDPYSRAYSKRVFELFEFVRGDTYDPSNEETTVDLEESVAAPYPYATQSSEQVGNQLMAIGHLIKTMALRPGSQVLELGCGWGNVALALAQMGHNVTAIDIAPSMTELVRERARRLGVSVEVHTGDFASASSGDGSTECSSYQASITPPITWACWEAWIASCRREESSSSPLSRFRMPCRLPGAYVSTENHSGRSGGAVGSSSASRSDISWRCSTALAGRPSEPCVRTRPSVSSMLRNEANGARGRRASGMNHPSMLVEGRLRGA